MQFDNSVPGKSPTGVLEQKNKRYFL